MEDKLRAVELLKDNISSEQYRMITASVVVEYFKDKIRREELVVNRQDLLFKVNVKLRSLKVAEISYGYLRNFY